MFNQAKRLVFITNCQFNPFRLQFRLKPRPSPIDRSKVPQLDENDLEEQFISGSGPGGQSVNKSVNCCRLKHRPTGLVVKVHQDRSLFKNRQIARQLLTEKLDDLINGEDSVSNQKKRIALIRIASKKAQQERRRAMKKEYMESLESESEPT